jgi:hypothetical protein
MLLTSKKSVEAKCVGASLVAAFHNAEPPLVWRFDLRQNHSFTLALQGEDGAWVLGLAFPNGDFHTVARFATREDAGKAFAVIEKILAKNKHVWLDYLLKFFGVVFLIAALVFAGMVVRNLILRSSENPATAGNAAPAASSYVSPNRPPEIKSGVPLPADEFLRPPP